MKSLVKSLLLSACLLFFINISAQNKLGSDKSNPGNTSSTADAGTLGSGSGSTTVSHDLGTPSSIYFNDWTPGKIVLKNNTVYEDWLLRYNMRTQQMQFIVDGDTSAIGNPDEILSIQIDQHIFLFDEFLGKNNIKRKGYLELLVDGNCKLYLHRCIAYRYVDACNEPGAENVKEEYYIAKRYLISENGNLPVSSPKKGRN